MSDQATAAQFRYSGPITVTHLNTRKEGDEDDKVLSVDVKFEARMSSGEVFGRFAPELHHDLFTDIGAVRNAMLGPITFAHQLERAAREQQEREHAAAQAQADKEAAAKKAVTAADPARPTDVQIVELLAGHYRVHPVEVIGWLRGIDFAALAPDLLSLAA